MQPYSPVRLATRRSPLALWQANWVADQLRRHEIATELVLLTSQGDTDQAPIDGTRGVGFFTKRIQQALLDNEADIAVHSLKDLPTEPQPEFHLAAIPPRGAVADCLISRDGSEFWQLPAGARIGTGSRRRCAQLLYHRGDLRVSPIRGNVQSRLQKLHAGDFDAIVLAEAGLTRLEMTEHTGQPFPLTMMLPAPGQGALGIETRADAETIRNIAALLDDPVTRAAVTAERTLLSHLSGGCLAPIAALSTPQGSTLHLKAVVLSTDGRTQLAHQASGAIDQAAKLGVEVAERLLHHGAAALITAAR